MLIKTEHISQSNTQNLLNICDYMRMTNPHTVKPSNIVYLSVLDAKADSKDTIMQVLQDANKQYIKGLNKQHIMINSGPLGTHRTFSDYTKFLIHPTLQTGITVGACNI